MKKLFLMIIMAAAVVACQKQPGATAKIDANGDCVFQNSLVGFRLNGAGNPVITDGFEAILKAQDGKQTVVKDRKTAMAASLNDGGSVLVANDSLIFPHANFESFEIVEQTAGHVTFTLSYPEWTVGEDKISLKRKITLRNNQYFCEVTDEYVVSSGLDVNVAAGFAKRGVEKNEVGKDYIIAWESVPGEGNMGVGIVVPMADSFEYDGLADNALALCDARYRKVTYAVGNCWSKGAIADFNGWAAVVK